MLEVKKENAVRTSPRRKPECNAAGRRSSQSTEVPESSSPIPDGRSRAPGAGSGRGSRSVTAAPGRGPAGRRQGRWKRKHPFGLTRHRRTSSDPILRPVACSPVDHRPTLRAPYPGSGAIRAPSSFRRPSRPSRPDRPRALSASGAGSRRGGSLATPSKVPLYQLFGHSRSRC